jgi:antitoxin (DNA-binding transcriptional repressor) of toxin-antitoxin stability system
MPTTLSVYDAKAQFSRVLENVEENRVTVTILRYGHPVAQIVPMKPKLRTLATDPRLAGKVKVNCDLFADDSNLWEACGEAALA